jgi:hypothetical protein
MKQVLGVLAFVLVLSACKKNNNNDSQMTHELSGRYTGTFNRTGMDTTNISFFFNEDKSYEGTGGTQNYPAICGGNFQQTGNRLVVNDTCAWTANFDWTLIFDGSYEISFPGENTVRIWRTNGATTDEYLLRRISR